MRHRIRILAALALSVLSGGCLEQNASTGSADSARDSSAAQSIADRMAKYTTVALTADTTPLTAKERQMIPLLIQAAQAMDTIYWMQSYGNRDSLIASVSDAETKQFVDINYGPWDRLDNNAPFVSGVGARPPGANLYPPDITKAEFDSAVARGPAARADSLKSLYTLVRRANTGGLEVIPYRVAFKAQNDFAAAKLREAAALAEDAGLKRYLTMRAEALATDNYQPSDLAWMDMKSNGLDIVIGPIETYEDELYGYKAANEGLVLIKDKSWSQRLSRYAAMLPSLQRGLPVPEAYKKETPGTDSDLNAYDAIFYAGQSNAGAKTIAINLPNDEEVQLRKGTRRLQLKNVIQAKFDKILMPIAQELMAGDQLPFLNFNAFFGNTMFHEVAHGLGIKNTINGKGPVRTALKERYGAVEEGKADILGLHMVQVLNARGDLPGEDVRGNYVSFLASLFRSTRFGGADAHGRANIAAFNYLQQVGAFTRDSASGKYRVDFPKFQAGMDSLSNRILTMQGNGDYEGLGAFQEQYGKISPELQRDLDRLKAKNIPVDVVFDQARDRSGMR
ncbi:MAG TPA: Zn-dependent hydrolase [Rhodothermia bacterium]|nr:Zn-dependent hydrolase [Rhodothermia bacterium]